VNNLRQYTIQFASLKDGLHDFSFTVDSKLFEAFEYEDIHGANLEAKVTLHKSSHTLTIDFNIVGTVEVQCDRCLDYFDLPLEIDQSQVVHGDGNDIGDDIDIMVIPQGSMELNVAQSIFDYVVINIPVRHVHPEDKSGKSTCNPEMMEQVDEYTIEEEEDNSVDPRWDKLKNLLK
jgi:uncharacterized protein